MKRESAMCCCECLLLASRLDLEREQAAQSDAADVGGNAAMPPSPPRGLGTWTAYLLAARRWWRPVGVARLL
ncbi:MAG: hypothetical protein ACKVP7_11545 [Hyphomicrobiaceae bacterium]